MLAISSALDSGNIRVLDASDPQNIRLEIVPEPFCPADQTAHFQWFHYRVVSPPASPTTTSSRPPLVMHMTNAGKSSFPEAWPGYQACASYDYQEWFRVPTEWGAAAGALTIRHAPERDVCFYAYFAPYPLTRHQELVAMAASERPDLVRCEVLGQTLDGRDLELLTLGHPGPGKKRVWIVARQHPGESMAEWFCEGLLRRLLGRHDALVDRCLQAAVFYLVPNMNPDGSVRGHLRTNAAGANLNREWREPRPDYSPEVCHVLSKMTETGCDAFFDVHGDEEFPVNFIAGAEGIPDFSAGMQHLQNVFLQGLLAASPDMQPQNKYGVDPPGRADMRIACNPVAERFRCLSVTIEQPFKDVDAHPDRFHGWSPQRAQQLGAACLQAIHTVLFRMLQLDAEKGGQQQGQQQQL